MTHEQFIQAIAPYVQKYARKFAFGCPSAIIAQACLESAYGTSDKAKHHNYFGLKYRQGRVSCHSGYFSAGSSEQTASGSYIPITTDWYAFKDMDTGVKGYFQFIQNGAYASAREADQMDPESYLTELRACGYATSLKYVDNLMKVIKANNLTRFDGKVAKGLNIIKNTRSSLHNTSVRYGGIQYIVVHYTASTGSAANHLQYFSNPSVVNASADFFVDETGIYQYNTNLSGRYSWAVGGGRQSAYGGKFYGKCTNPNSVSIEMCCKSNGGSLAANGSGWYLEPKTIESTLELTKHLMKQYNVPADRVIRHYDVTGKYCPGIRGWNTADGNTEEKWLAFKAKLSGVAPEVNPEPAKDEPEIVVPQIRYRIQTRNHGILAETGNGGLAGIANDSILKIRLTVTSGSIQYRVHEGGRWKKKVNGGTWAGDSTNSIDAIQIYYSTDPNQTGGQYYEAVYSVKPYDRSVHLPEVADTNWESTDGDQTAGIFGKPFTEFRCRLVKC